MPARARARPRRRCSTPASSPSRYSIDHPAGLSVPPTPPPSSTRTTRLVASSLSPPSRPPTGSPTPGRRPARHRPRRAAVLRDYGIYSVGLLAAVPRSTVQRHLNGRAGRRPRPHHRPPTRRPRALSDPETVGPTSPTGSPPWRPDSDPQPDTPPAREVSCDVPGPAWESRPSAALCPESWAWAVRRSSSRTVTVRRRRGTLHRHGRDESWAWLTATMASSCS